MLICTATSLLWAAAAIPFDRGAPELVPATEMNAAVSIVAIVVDSDGAIEGTLVNESGRKIGDVKVLVEYAWIWFSDVNHAADDPGWSMAYTLPVELAPGASAPVKITPLHTLSKRDDGHFLISAKVVGYTRYRWTTPGDH